MNDRSLQADHAQVREQTSRFQIVLVTHEFFPSRGGAGVYVQELADAAKRIGYDVRVLAPGHARWNELDLPVELEALTKSSWLKDWWYYPATTFHLIANRRRIEKQVLHLCQQGPLQIMLLLRLLGLVMPRRLIITLHGSELLQLSASRIGRRWLLRKLLGRADRVAVLSQWVRSELLRDYPEVAGKIVLAPGAPRADWSPLRHKADKSGAELTLLTVGRIHPRKGQRTILEALTYLDGALRGRLRYLVVGPVVSRRYAKSLRRLARDTGVEVVFTGEIDDEELNQYYADADIFVMTSEQQSRSVEGFGLAYLEASASGLPVVGFRVGGVEDAVRNGITGLLVEADDMEGLVGALTNLIKDSDLRKRLGMNGKEWAKKFSWQRSAKAIYEDLL